MTGAAGSQPGLPFGFRVELDPDSRQLDELTWFGGSPARVLRLSEAGRHALAQLRRGPVDSPAGSLLGRRLTDAGAAHPRPPRLPAMPSVTIIVPVRDRPELLGDCLAGLAHPADATGPGGSYPVVVVDDGSTEPAPIARVADRFGARLLVRSRNGGAGAARNTGLAATDSELVAFLDSDCVPSGDWIGQLAAQFADPRVAAVAPRIVAHGGAGWRGRYSRATSSLDLGEREARVCPGARVSYLPTAALLVRRAALLTLASPEVAGPFDEQLRVGEDVDLIWRLHEAGWRIRYQPSVRVGHREPERLRDLLARRYRYGTSAGPLAARHPAAMAPLALHPWPALTVAAILARQPVPALLAFAASLLRLRTTLNRAGIPAAGTLPAMRSAVAQTWLGAGRYCTQFGGPFLLAALLQPGGRHGFTRWGRRAAVGSLLLGPGLHGWLTRRPPLDPLRFIGLRIADDACYGAGVWRSSLAGGTLRPLLPTVQWTALRIDAPRRRREDSDTERGNHAG